MSISAATQGRGIVQTRDGEEIPVFYNMVVERGAGDGLSAPAITGRLSVSGDPWLESSVIDRGRILLTEEGRRFRVDVQPGGRGVETLPFSATPILDTISR